MAPNPDLRSDGYNFTPTIHNDTYDFISPSKQDLRNRAVLISGASKGIGRCAALSFARAGCSYIAIGARSPLDDLSSALDSAAKEAGHPSPTILTLSLDVTDAQSITSAAESVRARFGRLDILVNNAGYLENFVPIADSDPLDWWRSWDTNMRGVYLMTRAFLPLLLSSDTPTSSSSLQSLKTILSLSSIGAHMQMPGASAYQTSKLAVLRFTEFVDAEYGPKGILAYCIHPGGVVTELASKMPKEAHGYLIDTPELAADSLVWLTGTRRDWLAGRYVSVTWDMEELEGKREEIVRGDLLKVRLAVTA